MSAETHMLIRRVHHDCRLLAILLLFLSTPHARGQDPSVAAPDSTYLSALKWRNIGPNRGGRSIAVAGSTKRTLEYYFGAVGGGLWKTTDGGVTWGPVTDGALHSSSVGAVAVAESNPDIVWIGMGEVELRGNVMQGDGVYRSVDGGKSWLHMGLDDTQAIGRIRIHPTNPDIVYVAALGHPFGPSAERGVFGTRDGGKTWKRLLFRSEQAGAVDLALERSHPDTLYATTWQVYRKPWILWSGGEGSGIFKSTDGGESWVELTHNPGLPNGPLGRITITVSPADSRRLWAMVEASDGGIYRSDDAGATWQRTSDDRELWQRAFYFGRVYADPVNRDAVYVLNVFAYKSTDGGKTFNALPATHADFHDLWVDPANPERMIIGHDGGGVVSVNGGKTWTGMAYPTAQMYHVAVTKDFPYQVCGAQQDNDTACVRSEPLVQTRFDEISRPGSWYYTVGGNESGTVAPHNTNPSVFFAGGQEGYLTRFDRTTGQARDVQPFPRLFSGQSAGSVPERWQWTFPIAVSPLEANVVYAGSQHLWRSENEGQSWARISPDLTRADASTLGDSGGPITKDQNGPEFYATIFTIAPSRLEAKTIWVGSDDGLIHLTRDGGRTWRNVTPPDMKEFTRVSLIEASPHQPGTAYVAAKRYQLDDRAPYIWKTHNFGSTWTRIIAGIPPTDYVHAVREDPRRAGLLYAGTEHGVYVSFDEGSSWQSLALNLPNTQVPDLVVEQRDLVIATHGRSFWVLDDIEPIRQLTSEVKAARAHLFTPASAVRRVYPARIDYYLAEPASSLKLEILDAADNVIRTLSQVGMAAAGAHRVIWDLHYTGATVFPGMVLRSANPQQGPWASPGKYQVRLTVDGVSQTRAFALLADPRLSNVTQADLEEQFRLSMKIRDRVSAANDAVLRIRALKKQIDERTKRKGDAELLAAATGLTSKLSAIEEELYQVKNQSMKDVLALPIKLNNRLAALLRVAQSADARPTAQTYSMFEQLNGELERQLTALRELIRTDVAQFNEKLSARELEAIDDNR
jgi:photosystem II stability/assembly factor-like uncharacterized protein